MASSNDDKAPPGFPPPHPSSHAGPLPHTPRPIPRSTASFCPCACRTREAAVRRGLSACPLCGVALPGGECTTPDVQEKPFSVKMPEGARLHEEMVREVLQVLDSERLPFDTDALSTLRRIIQERNDP